MLSKTMNRLEEELAHLRELIKEEDGILTRLREVQSHYGEGLKLTDLIDIWLSEACLTVLTDRIATQILVADELLGQIKCKGERGKGEQEFRGRNNGKFEELVLKAERQFADEVILNEFCRRVRRGRWDSG